MNNKFKITEADIDRTEDLAHISLPPDEKDKMVRDLGEVLAYMAILEDIDVSGIDEMSHPQDLKIRLRADSVTESLSPQEALRNAPHTKDNLFKVSRII